MKVFILTLLSLCVLVSSENGACKRNSCKNNGTCSLNPKGKPICICNKPYFGRRCEKHPCKPNPCRSNGKCIAHGYTYFCNCKSSYIGVNCEISCDMTGDIMIAIQVMKGISRPNYDALLDAVIDIIRVFDIANGKTRIGIIVFGKKVLASYSLDTGTDKKNLISFVELLRNIKSLSAGRPRTHLALQNITNNFNLYGRKGYPYYAFTFVYSRSENRLETLREARSLKKLGTTVYAIGNMRRNRELRFIASTPSWDHVFRTRFSTLHRVIKKVLAAACTDVRPWNKCRKCKHTCNCPPGTRCCYGCCEEIITVRS